MIPRDILKKIRRLEIKTRGLVEAAFAGQYRIIVSYEAEEGTSEKIFAGLPVP